PPQQQEDTEMPPPPPPPQPSQPPQTTATTTTSSDPPPTSDPSETTPPPEPEPITPGPRAQRLRALFQQTTSHTLDKLSPPNFRECFPTISQKAPGTLDNVHRQMIDRLSTLWNREFERILETRQVVQRLNELEDLIQEAQQKRRAVEGGKGERPVPPHTLDADVVLQAHLRGYLKEQLSVLGGKLEETRGENKRLFEEVLSQRKEMEGLIKAVEGVVRDVKGASEVLGGVVGELEGETREVDRELLG
ncbi:Nnf1-domain-containing protein, partial [Triangularia verruculosa]